MTFYVANVFVCRDLYNNRSKDYCPVYCLPILKDKPGDLSEI